ncbi:hypothetical protein [Geomesophilobacter sediminis]|uniref:Uncharacterized protein n=1 Tax=Geomesophilobacter sediminis TaxID=2798584 RepID=A0A8J7IL70_9BACT|nr:hypothetical protein [Geomesophilobacter sediminis]MBJ6723453.1 hypothetical protein [Geomesophilobacter sediminis]
MDREEKSEELPVIIHTERRSRRSEELSSEEIMQILRDRGRARAARRNVIDVD